jgi:hypothetical protein
MKKSRFQKTGLFYCFNEKAGEIYFAIKARRESESEIHLSISKKFTDK